MPKGFPGGIGRATGTTAPRSSRARLAASLGTTLLHGALLAFLLHFQPVREVFGQRPAAEEEWIWLPEVACLATAPEPPLPEPVPKPPAEPKTISEPEPPPPPDPLPAENYPPPRPAPEPKRIAEPQPPPMPIPEPPPPAEIASATNRPDAWTEVRDGIVAALRYPALARRRGTEGCARLRLELDEAGNVATLEIQTPQPAQALGEAVRAAVRRAEPFPAAGDAIRRGEIPAAAVLAIRFKLE